MFVHILVLVCLSVSYSSVRADDTIDIPQLDEADKTSRALYAFCQRAILQDRGLTSTPFAGSTDKWILEELLPDRHFRAALNASAPTSQFAAHDSWERLTLSPKELKTASPFVFYTRADTFTTELLAELSNEQKERLPGVYLRIEGLVALCRPQFTGLFEDQGTQQRIRELVDSTADEKFLDVHRGLFLGIDKNERPTCHVWLRKWSAELDWRIVELLSKNERKRLWRLLSSSKILDDVVHASLPY